MMHFARFFILFDGSLLSNCNIFVKALTCDIHMILLASILFLMSVGSRLRHTRIFFTSLELQYHTVNRLSHYYVRATKLSFIEAVREHFKRFAFDAHSSAYFISVFFSYACLLHFANIDNIIYYYYHVTTVAILASYVNFPRGASPYHKLNVDSLLSQSLSGSQRVRLRPLAIGAIIIIIIISSLKMKCRMKMSEEI